MCSASIQDVPAYGFTLYFCAFTEESPPNADLRALENRPWVYQRPYTVLELQARRDETPLRLPAEGEAGYAGTRLDLGDDTRQIERLRLFSSR